MEHSIFYQLSLVMVIAASISLLARGLRQPLIIGYILTGIIVGPSLLHIIKDPAAFESFSQIGIALLLFIIGLGLNVSVIKSTSKPAFLVFLGITAGVGSVGLGLSYALGRSGPESLILATAILFSSTIVVIKALSDKKEQNRLHGQLTIAITLVEDLAATLALLLVSTYSGGGTSVNDVVSLLGKGALLGLGLSIGGGYIMPKLSKVFASNQELLYIFALSWAFGIASLFKLSGFSIEVGALFAGVSLAHLPYAQAISTKLKPLRDFFIVLFFIHLGEGFKIDQLSSIIGPALIFSIVIILLKPLIIMTTLGVMGYTKQTSFKTGIHLSQISEFSIILLALAQTSGLVGSELTAIATLIALITIAASAYLMKYDDELYKLLKKPLSIFERASTKRETVGLSHYPLVLIGYHEGGYSFVQSFREMKKRYVVIDYDPEIIERLEHQRINHIYGDATDIELLEEIGAHHSELVISTLDDPDTNRMLARYITEKNNQAVFICHAKRLDDAESLYEAGASYVLMPHFIGDEHINQFLKRNGSDKQAFARYKSKHLFAIGTRAGKET